jgi:hypothetical protein
MINKAKAFIIIGNQLFSPINLKSFNGNEYPIFELDFQIVI